MNPHLIDSHCHPPEESDHHTTAPPGWLLRAREAGVRECIAVGTDVDDWEHNRSLAIRFPESIHWTAGLHPSHVGEDFASRLRNLPSFLDDSTTKPPCALGEIGLDFTRLPKDRQTETISWQKDAFRSQLEMAHKRNLPVIIHSRGTVAECLEIIGESGIPAHRTIFHCFAEGPATLQMLRAAGAKCSFTGILTFKNAREVREALAANGLENLILETDSPYLSPEPFRGKTNEPARVATIADYCAEFFGTTTEEIYRISHRNTRDFFGLPAYFSQPGSADG